MSEDTTKINERYSLQKHLLTNLTNVIGEIASCHDSETLAEIVVNALSSLIQVEACSFAAWKKEEKTPFLWHHSRDMTEQVFEGDLLSCTFTRGVKALEKGYVVQANISHSGLSSDELKFLRENGLKSILVVPFSRGDFKGCISALMFTTEKFFEEQDILIAKMIANQIASVLENIRLYQKEKAY